MASYSLNTLFCCKVFLEILNHSTDSPNVTEDECSVLQDTESKYFVKYLSLLKKVHAFLSLVALSLPHTI